MTVALDLDKLNLLAHRAARSAQSQFGSMDMTDRDYFDMRQEAAIAVWKAVSAAKPDAYAFAAGRNAAIEWQRQWRGMKDHRTGEATPPTFFAGSIHRETVCYFAPGQDDGYFLADEVIEELFELFLNARRAKGRKEIDGAVKAATIMRLIAAGYNNLGIAQEMQMSYYNVRNYRRQIRVTLATLIQTGGQK